MTNTVKFSQFSTANLSDPTNMAVGYGSSTNYQTPVFNSWTTANRPVTPYNGLDGYNTDLSQWEYWDGTSSMWVQFAAGSVGVTSIDTGTGLTGGPITSTGTISFAPIPANSFWANTSGSTAVPTVTSLAAFLLSANNLSDLTNAATARTNLGLAIGTNVEAWSHELDLIAAGTWPGSTSITTLGTITTGVWNGSTINVSQGGTGNTSFTAYSVICAGTSSTSAFQNVVGIGSIGQVLTSQGTGQLPIWSNTSGSGTVNSGLINQLAWYAASGTVISGLGTANNGVLVTSGAGVPSIGNTLPTAVQGNITSVGTIGSGTWEGDIIGMTFGGTGASLTPTANNIVYSTASNLALLATNDNGVLVTDPSGIPSISSTLPTAVQGNITSLGTITSGAWNGTAITVPFGGSGLTSVTAYAVICGGTTSTDALQQVSGLGSLGQVLTSQGAGTLPIWANATGTGTVNSGLINQLAWYAATGNTISGLATAANGVLITSGTNVPSISSTLPAAVQGNITKVGTVTSGDWSATPITVNNGGTGKVTFTAYSVICAGTTATGVFQNVVGVGTSGFILTSNGAGALPTWQANPASGTVNSGSINQLAWYAANGSAVSGLATANNAMLVTSSTGVPSLSATLGQGLAISSSILSVGAANNIPFNTGVGFQDSNGNNLLLFDLSASAVNYFQITNSPTGQNPLLSTNGSDTNIGISLETKGVGNFTLFAGGTATANVMMQISPVNSSVNGFGLTTAATGGSPSILSIGTDTNIGLLIGGKGTGQITIANDSGTINIATFSGTSTSDVNYLAFSASTTGVAPSITATGTDTNILLQLNGTGTSGVGIQGSKAGGIPAAGNIGETISAGVLVAGAVSLTSPSASNITSISVTAGNWLIFGNAVTVPGTGTTTSFYAFGLNTSTGALPLPGSLVFPSISENVAIPANGAVSASVGSGVLRVTGNTTIFLVAQCTFAISTLKVYGSLTAVRLS